MTSSLADAFRADLRCSESVAHLLASLAQQYMRRVTGSSEDSEEDVVLRLRDPRVFGDFAEAVRADRRVSPAVRNLLIEHAFDLLPLPRTEGEVIAVETRAPRHLLSLAAALAAEGGLSVLHVMHLVYAVFLDRSLVSKVPRRTRSAVLQAIVEEGGSGENLRVLYASLHLATVPEPEAASELRRILADAIVPFSFRRSLAALAAAEDGGHASLTRMAQREGLLPETLENPQEPSILASIPRLSVRLRTAGRRFLDESDSA